MTILPTDHNTAQVNGDDATAVARKGHERVRVVGKNGGGFED